MSHCLFLIALSLVILLLPLHHTSFYHKIHSLQDPTAAFVIRKLLGFKRAHKRHDLRAPITETILRKICNTLPSICYSEYECNLFKAAYLLAFFGLLRVSEVVFTSQIQANRPLLFADVQVEGSNAVLINIRISKTNLCGLSPYCVFPFLMILLFVV